MVVQLEDGSYLHTAYAISNVASELLPDEWSTTEQGEGMDYVGQYVDDSPLDSDDATDYEWEALYDLDVDDTDEDDVMPVADEQVQIGAIEEQLNILQQDSEELFDAIGTQADNVRSANDISSSALDIANATNQHFWTDDNGVHVSNEDGNPEGDRNTLWNSIGMLFRKGAVNLLAILGGGSDGTGSKGVAVYDGSGNTDDNIVARFIDSGSQIGKTAESHLEMNYHSMQMVDSDGETYFHVSDLRNEDGYIVQTETGDGSTYIFTTLLQPNEVISVTVDGATVSATAQDNTVVLNTTPPDGSEVIIAYVPFPENLAKAYTLGQRAEGEPIGAMSVAEGVENSASGNYSHVEGGHNVVDTYAEYCHAEGRDNTIASCHYSHVEGTMNSIQGSYAHAEGIRNQALADASHVEGEGNIANGWGQHVVGRYNVEKTDALEVVGNGSATNSRSNARVLYTNGNEWLADTLVVSRNPTRPMEVATKDYVDNSGGGTVTAEDVTVDGSDFAQNPEWSEALDQSENVQEALTYLSLIAYDTTEQVIALEGSKQDGLISGSNIKTINGNSILGSGNLVIGGGGGTSDYSNLTNKPKINSVELSSNKSLSDLGITLANLGGVPTTRTINGNALSSNITLDASDVGALPDTTVIPTKVSDLTNDSGFIPKDDLFFKSGDTYSVSYNHARALTGYVSSSTKGIYFEIPLPKFLTDVTGATITAMTGGVRGVSGYVNGFTNGSNLKRSGLTVTASVDNPNTLYVSIVSSSTLTNVTNNTPVSVALNSVSITFS